MNSNTTATHSWEITVTNQEGNQAAILAKTPGNAYRLVGDVDAIQDMLSQLRAMPGFFNDQEAAGRRAYEAFLEQYPDTHGNPPWDQLNPTFRNRWMAIAEASRG